MSKRRKSSKKYYFFRYFILGSFIAALVLAKGLGGTGGVKVLGVSISSMLLADKGSDSGDHGGSSGGDSHSDSGGSSGGGSGSSGSSGGGDHGGSSGGGGESHEGSAGNSGGDSHGGSGSSESVSGNTRVLCTGPDGKQFQTDFSHCSELDNGWHAPVTFTVLSEPVVVTPKSTPKPTPKTELENISVTPSPIKTEEREVKKKEAEKVEFKVENGKAKAVKKAGETEVELEENEALEEVNEALKGKEVEVEATKAGFTLTHKEAEAETELPISINPTTKALTVTTPAGEKEVTILPDEAVNHALREGALTQAEVHTTKIKGVNKATLELTELNGEPVFKVKGVAQKKLLGLTPVIFPKTVVVSAITGAVERIEEPILDRLLELFSF